MDLAGRRLAGRSCLIVGGTGGIGLATARAFLAEGGLVALTGRTAEEIQTARDTLFAENRLASFLQADVLDVESVETMFSRAGEALGRRLDVLVHVAGRSGRRNGDGLLEDCTEAGWDATLAVNARGAFLTNRAAVRRMLSQTPDDRGMRGSVVNVGSVLAFSPAPDHFGTIAYAASKGALQAMTLAAASAYAPEGIRFNLVAPGLIETPMSARAVQDPAIRAYLETKQPLAHGPGSPEDVAALILSLAEPSARLVTGAVLAVDGGWHLRDGQLMTSPRP